MQSFPELFHPERTDYLDNFANRPSNLAILPNGMFWVVLAKNQKPDSGGKSRKPQCWQWPFKPEEMRDIKDLVDGKDHLLIPISFISINMNLKHQKLHLVTLHYNRKTETLKYYSSKFFYFKSDSLEYKRYSKVQKDIRTKLKLYDLTVKKVEPVFAKERIQ